MRIKHSITFNLRPYGRKNTRFQIRIRATYNCQRKDFATGCHIDVLSAWDTEKQMVIPGYKGSKGETTQSINVTLRKQKNLLEQAFLYFEENDTVPTLKELSAQYTERLNQDTSANLSSEMSSLLGVLDQFVTENREKNSWTKATLQKMATLRSDLAAFDEYMTFDDMTEKTLARFVAFLREKKEGQQRLADSTIEKKLGFLRWFLKWAADMGYKPNEEYKSYKPVLKKTHRTIIYLTKEEIDRIKALELSETSLDQARDVLLFCCFSGLRHNSVYNLRRTDIKNDCIEVPTAGTKDPIRIELNRQTRKILAKYEDADLPEGKALPVNQNQPLNQELKILCRLAGIDDEIRISADGDTEVHPKWELISTDTGRNTFIMLAITNDVPASIVLYWTGLNDLKALKPYYDLIGLTEAEAMKKLENL